MGSCRGARVILTGREGIDVMASEQRQRKVGRREMVSTAMRAGALDESKEG